MFVVNAITGKKRRNKPKKKGFFGQLLTGAGGFTTGFALAALQKTKKLNQAQSEIKKQKIEENLEPKIQSNIQSTDVADYDQLEQLMVCPITQNIMTNPVILAQCGHTFEKKDIEQWILKNEDCPLCKIKVTKADLKMNYQLKQIIEMYQSQKGKKQREEESDGQQQYIKGQAVLQTEEPRMESHVQLAKQETPQWQ